MEKGYPLLSIIVPVYNTEKFLRKCLDSLLSETYPNIEIIVVNDGSTDRSQEIIDEYIEEYSNVRCVINNENQGLFHARLRGYEAAKGDYICSVDSDDYVGVDYHRQLILKALETNADIVVSKFVVHSLNTNTYEYWTYGNYDIEDIDLENENIIKDFAKTELETAHRWLVWNKVYKKDLWDRCYQDFINMNANLTMLEDVVYGIVLMSKAKRYVSCNEDTYFYCKHNEAATGINGNVNKLIKNLNHQITAFTFIENFINKYNMKSILEHSIKLMREKQKRIWMHITSLHILTKRQEKTIYDLLDKISSSDVIRNTIRDDGFFYGSYTNWDNRYEQLKNMVKNPKIEIVSFDIFDTLILRPFLKPTDIFYLLNKKWDEVTGNLSFYTFSDLRVKAESLAREVSYLQCKTKEDITIDEIYEQLSKISGVSVEQCNIMKEQEKILEVNFCIARKKLKEIYDLAIFLSKKVICITDMYLDRETIIKILEKNEYTKIYKLFISSEEKLTKSTGNIYIKVLHDLKINPEKILHIGDNWHSDISKANDAKFNTYFVPKSEELFDNKIPNINGKTCRASFADVGILPTGNILKYTHRKDYIGIRCMLGLVANKIFDHPYLSYEEYSDFNRNPYYVGYYALGMHLYGIVQWLIKLCKLNNYKQIHFVARDGYMAMQIYNILTKDNPLAPKANYLHISRKSILPLLIKNDSDLYNLSKLHPWINKTPKELIEILSDIVYFNEDIENEYWKNQVLLDKPIANDDEYKHFIDVLVKLSYSQEKVNKYRKIMKKYFSSIIGESEVMYDIGYSGRAQAILSDLLEYPVHAAYIHFSDDKVYQFSDRFNFNIHAYYDYYPSVTGTIRELLQSNPTGSCIGYNINKDEITPLFEEHEVTYQELFVINRIHQGACDFVQDLVGTFKNYLPELYYRDFELSFAHEYLLHYPKNNDIQMFSAIKFDDPLIFGKGIVKSISELWKDDLLHYKLDETTIIYYDQLNLHIQASNKFKKLIFYILFDRDSLKNKVKSKYKNHPIFLKMGIITYKILRRFYRMIRFKKKNYTQ